jgi:ELWxxDGT repeat protein
LVKDINPSGASNPNSFLVVGDTLYFFADDGTHGVELWMSDGSTTGTQLVANIGNVSSYRPEYARYLSPCGDRVCFTGVESVHGTELWETNCKPGAPCPICADPADCPGGCPDVGICLLRDIYPGPEICVPPHKFFGVLKGVLYFEPYGGSYDLWVSDGTRAGTRPYKEIDPTPFGQLYGAFVVQGDKAFFTVGDRDLWMTDGMHAAAVWTGAARIVEMVVYHDRLYLSAVTAGSPTGAMELYVASGTPGEVYPACPDRTLCLNPTNMTVVNDRLWLTVDSPVGHEPMVFP